MYDPDATPASQAIAEEDDASSPMPKLAWPPALAAASVGVRIVRTPASLFASERGPGLLEEGAGALPTWDALPAPALLPDSDVSADGTSVLAEEVIKGSAADAEETVAGDSAEASKETPSEPADALPEIEFEDVPEAADLEAPEAMNLLNAVVDLSSINYVVDAPTEPDEQGSRLTTAK